MEPEATKAPQAKKKRRPEAPDGQQSDEIGSLWPPLATPAVPVPSPIPFGAGPGHRSPSRQQPLVGAGAGGGARGGSKQLDFDRISALPDGVLGDIISRLPTQDAGRTVTLASRWKHMWRYAPLNLDCQGLPGFGEDNDALAATVTRIVSAHPGPCRRFFVGTGLLLHYPRDTVDGWLSSPALDGLEEIYMAADEAPAILPQPTLPEPLFRFTPSLTVATLSDCTLPDITTQELRFPKLKMLSLEHVTISEDSVHAVIAACPVLEGLLLVHSHGYKRLRIVSSSLRSFGVADHPVYVLSTLEEIVVQDAPCLERFLFLESDMVSRVQIVSAPKLETLGCLNDLNGGSKFTFGSTVIEGLHIISSISAVSSVKTLAIDMDHLFLDTAINLMKCFPCLETLYFKLGQFEDDILWQDKYHEFIRSHDIRLKKIVFLNYRGTVSQFNFATFFIANAKRLEIMRFEGGPDINNKNFLALHHRLLQLVKRASEDAKFRFAVSTCDFHLAHIKDVHDLSITDPFKCTC